MTTLNERRRAARHRVVSLVVTCYLKVGDLQYQGILRDMSTTGIFIELDDKPEVPAPCEVEVVLKGQNSRLRIEGLHGNVVRTAEDGVGIHFDARMEWFALVSTYFTRML